MVAVGPAIGNAEQVAAARLRAGLDVGEGEEGAVTGIVHQDQAVQRAQIAQPRDAVLERAEVVAEIVAVDDLPHVRA